ncbi:DUF2867 domain-containing protein [Agromyces sp. NPDC049794]|uniref:DUF2867 domain-containing protein n=1 Tax=unclassified Agromyces TaxID=2639701 RepID=UPI0033F59EA4
MSRRLPIEEHISHPWRIHELTPDFAVEDVWELDTPGGPGQLDDLLSAMVNTDFPQGAPAIVRFLWDLRWRLGAILGWDKDGSGLGSRVRSLRERMPADLYDRPIRLAFDDRFTTMYHLDDEWAAELANRTVHTVMHLGWVPDGQGGYRGQMAVLVKANGFFGRLYMAFIKPFRYTIIYPALLGGLERRWRSAKPAADLASGER